MDHQKFARATAVFAVALICGGASNVMADGKSPAQSTASKTSAPAGYVEYQSVPLDPAESGITGALQILQDQRVTPEYRQSWGESAEPFMALGEGNPLFESIKSDPLRNGHLRLLSSNGNVITDELLEEPLAKLETVFLYGTKFPTYLVSVDYGIGMGSYAGPATTLVEVRNGKLAYFSDAEDTAAGKNRLWLGQSLKNGWQIVPSLTSTGKEIEQVQCHPHFESPKWADWNDFVIVYSTYRFAQEKWHQTSRESPGFWENEDGWPKRSEFP